MYIYVHWLLSTEKLTSISPDNKVHIWPKVDVQSSMADEVFDRYLFYDAILCFPLKKIGKKIINQRQSINIYRKIIQPAGLHTNFFSWWPDRATKIINYQLLVARTGNLVARKKKSEMNGGNIRLRMTLKINVGCRKWINGGNIRLLMTLK